MTLKALAPPSARHAWAWLRGSLIRYRGPYADWGMARAATAGYADADILRRVLEATTRVLAGEADYEQDGVPMHGDPGTGPALRALLRAAVVDGGLSVLDFGGGLGSHFLRWRAPLASVPHLAWCVVEQPQFASAGERLFPGGALRFVERIGDAKESEPNVVLVSSVLQYLPDPIATLRELVAVRAGWIILDRTPFARDGRARILTQHVPADLGAASYPLRTLSKHDVAATLGFDYAPEEEFSSDDAPIRVRGAEADYRGAVWRRKSR